jgi:N-acetylglucosamine-6-phosphate deacetylase
MNSFIMTNARVLQQHGEHNGCDIVVEKGVIKGITPPGLSSPDTELPTIDLAGQYIATAPIEFHIHGAGPFGFEMDQPDILEKGVCFLQDRGVGWVMPTLAFSEPPLLRLVDELEAKPWLQDVVPGIYLEGPFINSKKRGGIQMHMIAPPDPDHLKCRARTNSCPSSGSTT